MLQHALKAQAKGFWIFPSAPGEKIPHRLAGKWGETATNDINRIVHFWTKVDPKANPCIACKPSQLLVVDLDKAKADWNLRDTEWAYMHAAFGHRVDGEDLFNEMWFNLGKDQPGNYEATHSVRTRSGGLHLCYRWPASWPRISQASPVKGVVDVRGNGGQYGGYVLAEGSLVGGGEYLLQGDYPISYPPQWIRQLVVEKPQAPKIQRPRGLMQPSAISWSGLVDSVRNAGEGNRNNALLWAARAMYSDKATVDEAKDALGPAAREAGLGEWEIERTIESAYRIQQQKEG